MVGQNLLWIQQTTIFEFFKTIQKLLNCFTFFDFGHLSWETEGQSWTEKNKLWVRLVPIKAQSF